MGNHTLLDGWPRNKLVLFATARPGMGRRKPQYAETYKPAQCGKWTLTLVLWLWNSLSWVLVQEAESCSAAERGLLALGSEESLRRCLGVGKEPQSGLKKFPCPQCLPVEVLRTAAEKVYEGSCLYPEASAQWRGMCGCTLERNWLHCCPEVTEREEFLMGGPLEGYSLSLVFFFWEEICMEPDFRGSIHSFLPMLGFSGGSFYFLFLNFIYLFLERGEGKEKERERNINVWLPLMCPPLGTWPTTQACALTANQTGTLCFAGQCSIHWATTARADRSFYSPAESRERGRGCPLPQSQLRALECATWSHILSGQWGLSAPISEFERSNWSLGRKRRVLLLWGVLKGFIYWLLERREGSEKERRERNMHEIHR